MAKRFFDPALPTGLVYPEREGVDACADINDPFEKFKNEMKLLFVGISDHSLNLLYQEFNGSNSLLENATNAYLDKPHMYKFMGSDESNGGTQSRFFQKGSKTKPSQMTFGSSSKLGFGLSNGDSFKKWEGVKSVSGGDATQHNKKRKITNSKIQEKAVVDDGINDKDPNKWTRYIGTFNMSCWCTRMVISLKSIYLDNTLTLSKPNEGTDNNAVYVHHSPASSQFKRELGRLSEDSAEFISPILEQGMVEFKCKLFYVDGERLGTGDTFIIRADCFICERGFRSVNSLDHLDDEQGKNIQFSKVKKGGILEPETRIKSGMLKLFDHIDLIESDAKPIDNASAAENNPAEDDGSLDELEINRELADAEDVIDENENDNNEEDSEDSKKLTMNQVRDLYKNTESSFIQTSLPESYPPNFMLELRPYQRQGLSWMLQREKEFGLVGMNNENIDQIQKDEVVEKLKSIESSMNPLWKGYLWPHVPQKFESSQIGEAPINQNEFFINLYDGSCSLFKPVIKSTCNGGILADEMGLGKTITTLSLIFAVPRDDKANDKEIGNFAFGTTLIIVPMALLTQWEKEFNKCNGNSDYHYCMVYYGSNTGSLKKKLLSKKPPTIVLTTYGTVQSEWSNNSQQQAKGLFNVHFFRIILDEGHTIRNRNTKTAKAIYSLSSERKWVLTGTPIINRLEDLYSLVHFLNLKPWSNFSLWRQCITIPFDTGKGVHTAMNLLKSILDPLLLRRTKNQRGVDGKLLVWLPDKKIQIEKLKFNNEEQRIYDFMKAKAVTSFNENMRNGGVFKNYSSILTQLLRLRQVCCHFELIKKDNVDLEFIQEEEKIEKEELESLESIEIDEKGENWLTPEEFKKLKVEVEETYKTFQGVECSICTDDIDLNTCIITECKHGFCDACLDEHFEYQTKQGNEVVCPMCRAKINKHKVVKTVKCKDDVGSYKLRMISPSSKINALLGHLERNEDSSHVIVFSQFTSFLDLIQLELELMDDYKIVKFDGRLNLQQREEAIENFEKVSGGKRLNILLLSLKAGGVGLNLTVANKAYLMDPHWNNAIEHQAIDRIHRMGQQKSVEVVRFIMESSIEERMLKIQARKNQLGEALTINDEERRQRRLEELQSLFAEG